LLLVSTCLAGVNEMGKDIAATVKLRLQGVRGPYTDSPGSPYLGQHPGRQERGRGGVWSQDMLDALDAGDY
jgi:hypothetical protein